MTHDPPELISRYFDELLTEAEHSSLQEWLLASPDHRQEFVRAALLHDALRGDHQASALMPVPDSLASPVANAQPRWRSWWIPSSIAAVCIAIVLLSVEWGKTSVVAATELRRIIAAQEGDSDRTYRLAVEDIPAPQRRPHRGAEERRPPKPPLDGAILHVRKGSQFVLIRPLAGGQQFVTGSNGETSWAVRPDGPVRVSRDLTRFNRDLPGHEHDFPLLEIAQGLAHLQDAYHIVLLPLQEGDGLIRDPVPTRLLVAVKKPGHRGPQRVEITYVIATGQIRQLRFVEMPYGPELLTVRLTQEEGHSWGPDFFDHPSHHASDRIVEEE